LGNKALEYGKAGMPYGLGFLGALGLYKGLGSMFGDDEEEKRGMDYRSFLGKFAAQDNATSNRYSATGESSGLSFADSGDNGGYANGTDAWNSVSRFMKQPPAAQPNLSMGKHAMDGIPPNPDLLPGMQDPSLPPMPGQSSPYDAAIPPWLLQYRDNPPWMGPPAPTEIQGAPAGAEGPGEQLDLASTLGGTDPDMPGKRPPGVEVAAGPGGPGHRAEQNLRDPAYTGGQSTAQLQEMQDLGLTVPPEKAMTPDEFNAQESYWAAQGGDEQGGGGAPKEPGGFSLGSMANAALPYAIGASPVALYALYNALAKKDDEDERRRRR
jgi:hypothetical protein